ncbi:unnamed protein product [Candida verbasci]|uniref:Cyclin n=1 Tax=Candida verbasci TaxID=1227364 RepID=A0A9W4XDN6_9ASCO|nr:unnamed protein product [Candida verbasci]
MTTFVKDVTDIPSLKPPQETFVDEPRSIEEISFDDLIFDISNKLKNISNLHVWHLIYLMNKVCLMIIKLQEDKELFKKFRLIQLEKLAIKLEEEEIISDSIDSNDELEFKPLKLTKFNDASFENINEDEVDEIEEEGDENLETPYIPIETLTSTPIPDPHLANLDEYSKKLQNEIKLVNKQRITPSKNFKIFNLVKIPSLSILQFLIRIKTYSPNISTMVYLQSIYLLFKLTILTNSIRLNLNNIYRIIVGSLRSLTKLFDDIYQKQKIFTNVVGVPLKDLFKIEINFLYLVNFNLFFSGLNNEIFDNFLQCQIPELCEFMKCEFGEFYENEIRNDSK